MNSDCNIFRQSAMLIVSLLMKTISDIIFLLFRAGNCQEYCNNENHHDNQTTSGAHYIWQPALKISVERSVCSNCNICERYRNHITLAYPLISLTRWQCSIPRASVLFKKLENLWINPRESRLTLLTYVTNAAIKWNTRAGRMFRMYESSTL